MADTTLAEALTLITKVSSNNNKRISFLEKITGVAGGSKPGKGLGDDEPDKPRQVVKKAEPVIVTDFGKKAEEDLMRSGDEGSSAGADSEQPGGPGSFLKQLLGPALTVLGGLGALVGGIFAEGGSGIQDTLQVIGKGGLSAGLKMAAKGIGSLIKPLLKKIPLIGSLISFGFAYSAFKNNDHIGGLFDLASGLTGLLYFFPPAIPFILPLQLGIDTLSAILSANTEVQEGETMGQAKGRVLGDFMKGMYAKMKDVFPLRNFLAVGEGVGKVFSGDVGGGLKTLASALPVFDIFNLISNLFFGTDDSPAETADKMIGGAGDFLKNIGKAITNIYPIKNLMEFYKGIGNVFSGNFKEGFHQMAFALPFMKPIANFLFGKREEVDPETGEIVQKKSLTAALKEGAMKRLRGSWKKMGGWVKKIMRKFLPDNVVKSLDEGKPEEDETDGNMGYTEADRVESEAAEARKDGGPVKSGTEYMVGEEGPELFVPETDGNILDNKTTSAILDNREQLKMTQKTNALITQISQSHGELLSKQVEILMESKMLLTEIADKTGVSTNNIISNNTSVTNMSNQRSLRDLQETYA